MTFPTPRSSDAQAEVTAMLPGTAMFVVSIFRHFELFRNGYDQRHLEAALANIRRRLGADRAEGVMSDALLVDNELRLRTSGHFLSRREGSPTASEDERALVQMIAALQQDRYRLAAECALSLDILQSRTMLLLASRLASRLRNAGLDLAPVLARTDAEVPARPFPVADRPALRVVEAVR